MSPATPTRTTPIPRFLTWMLALLLAAFGSLSTGAAVAASDPAAETAPAADTTVTWSVRPADTAEGSGRPNFAYELAPGGTLADALLVTNRSPAPITLDVYAADGFLTADGALDILPGGEESTDLGSWITIDGPALELASGESAEVPFSLDVPDDVPPGDYAAGIVASMLVTAENGTVTERRLGSRIHLRVLGDLAPALSVSDVSVSYDGSINPLDAGAASVTYTLTNTGNTRLAPAVGVSASGPFGWAGVSAFDDAPELLPGSSVTRTLEVAGAPALFALTADVTATAEIVSPGVTAADALPGPVIATGSAVTAAIPWTVLIALVVAAALLAWLLVMRRRRTLAQRRAVDDAVAAALRERDAAEAERVEPAVAGGSPPR
jgi:hypothetical protein